MAVSKGGGAALTQDEELGEELNLDLGVLVIVLEQHLVSKGLLGVSGLRLAEVLLLVSVPSILNGFRLVAVVPAWESIQVQAGLEGRDQLLTVLHENTSQFVLHSSVSLGQKRDEVGIEEN